MRPYERDSQVLRSVRLLQRQVKKDIDAGRISRDFLLHESGAVRQSEPIEFAGAAER